MLAVGLCLAVAIAMCATPAAAQVEDETTFVLKAGRVYTMTDEGRDWFIDDGMILVVRGKIKAVGRDLAVPPFVEVIDLPDAVVMPGLVSANSSIVRRHTGEDTVGAQYLALDGFDPYANYSRVLAGGVTTVYLNPGRHRLLSGVGAVVKLGATPEDAVLKTASDLVINLGERAFNPPAKQHWLVPPSSDQKIDPSDVQRPTSRLGQILQLNESFEAALAYAAAREGDIAPNEGEQRPDFDAGLETLARMLRRKATVRINADRATDLEQAVRFCRRWKHDFILTGAVESRLLAETLAKAKAPIVYAMSIRPGSATGDLGPDPDRLEDRLIIPEALHELPIAVAGPEGGPHGELMFYAAAARRAGLSRRKAIESVTSTAAKILRVDDRVGSIQPGRDADLVVLNGEPLLSTTHVRRVYVNGRAVFGTDEYAGDKLADTLADALVVKAGKVWTGREWISGGEVLIEDGRIVAVGETAPHPPHARVIDAGPGAVLTPGFIDAHGHLGLEGDHTAAGADVSIARALYRARPEFARVARAGVTTVLTSTYRPGGGGSRISAIHTAGENRDELIVKKTAGLIFSFRGQDPESVPGKLRKTLAAGKKYDDAWKKYEKALAEYKAKGPKKQPDKKPKEKKEEVVVEKPKEDPVTGTWEGNISGAPLPEPQEFIAKLKLDGNRVEGSIETIFGGGESVALSGTYEDKHLSLELDVDIPFGNPTIEADIDRDDHMTGTLAIGSRFSFDLEAERTEKDAPKITITRRRKKKSDDGAPEAPKKDEALEPYRDLFAGRIPMVLDVDSRQIIESILPVFEKDYKVPFVLLNAEEAGKVAEMLAKAKTGVILPPQTARRLNRREYVQSIDLSRAEIPLAFQSNAEDAARHLPDRAAYDVRRGLDATAALKALTGDVARMFRCDDEVGVLAPGCRGDLVVFDGPPLQPGTRVKRVFINGKEVIR